MAQEIHRWRSNDGDPTLGTSWDTGIAPGGARRYRDLTFTGLPSNNDTITLSYAVYTFKTAINDATPREVLIGATADECADNLVAAINAGAGAGTLYSSATVSHVLMAVGSQIAGAVEASNPSSGVVRLMAYCYGTKVNPSITEALTNATLGSTVVAVNNWSANAIALFDGVSNVACQGTGRLVGVPFAIRQTEDAEHNIGSPSNPLRIFRHTNYEHVFEGGGQVYIAAYDPSDPYFDIIGAGTISRFVVRRFEGAGYIEFQSDPYDSLVIESGRVGVKLDSGEVICPIILDGLDADLTVISGKMVKLWSRNGRFISESVDSSDASAANWIVEGGIIETKTRMLDSSWVFVNGGIFRPIPIDDPSGYVQYGINFLVSNGVLDLSESTFPIIGRIIQRPPGEVWGGVMDPPPFSL